MTAPTPAPMRASWPPMLATADDRAGDRAHRTAEESAGGSVVVIVVRRWLIVVRLGDGRLGRGQSDD